MAWALAGIHDALKSNNPALARARTALALAAVDQSALDSGSWAFAQEMTLENPPPYHSFANEGNPDPTEQPSARLVASRQGQLLGEPKAIDAEQQAEAGKCRQGGDRQEATKGDV